MVEKVGRNDPCPCGSGKKYKACCMQKEQSKMVGGKRKFTAKLLSGPAATVQNPVQQQPQKVSPDYNSLMERTFGGALHPTSDQQPKLANPSEFLPKSEEKESSSKPS